MKIVHVVEAWKGGVASYVKNLIDRQLSDGNEVYLLADEDNYNMDFREVNAEIVFYSSSRNPVGIVRAIKEISKNLAKINADIIHCHSTFPGVYCRICKFHYKSKIIYTPHGWSFFKVDVGFFRRFFFSFSEFFLSFWCERIICMSLEEIRAAKKIGINEKKLALVYTGIIDSSDSVEIKKDDLVGPLKIGFFGRFDYQKGYDYLVESIPYISEDVELHFFGSSVRNEHSEIQASNVTYHGWVEHGKLHENMRKMDALIIPSRWEGLSLTALEGMRAGKAILISGFSSLPEVVIHGFNGLILSDLSPLEMAKAVNSLSVDDCKVMGVNARLVFEKCYTFEKYYEEIQKVYRGQR